MKAEHRTKKELEDYARRIEEVFRKHGIVIRKEYEKGTAAIFPGSKSKGEQDER